MSLTDVKDLLVVVSHYDDEVLFCGGTLHQLHNKASLHIVVATHVADTNFGDQEAEADRQRARLQSFADVLEFLELEGHNASHLGLPNYRGFAGTFVKILCDTVNALQPIIDNGNPKAVLTHNFDGEYGNWAHRLLHYAVRECAKDLPVWVFDKAGPDVVGIDTDAKRTMMDFYKHSVVPGQPWDPHTQMAFKPWCGTHERFSKVR